MNLQERRVLVTERMQEAINDIKKKGMMKKFFEKYALSYNALSRSNIEKCLPSAVTLMAISDYTGISADWILGVSDNKYSKRRNIL